MHFFFSLVFFLNELVSGEFLPIKSLQFSSTVKWSDNEDALLQGFSKIQIIVWYILGVK